MGPKTPKSRYLGQYEVLHRLLDVSPKVVRSSRTQRAGSHDDEEETDSETDVVIPRAIAAVGLAAFSALALSFANAVSMRR